MTHTFKDELIEAAVLLLVLLAVGFIAVNALIEDFEESKKENGK